MCTIVGLCQRLHDEYVHRFHVNDTRLKNNKEENGCWKSEQMYSSANVEIVF